MSNGVNTTSSQLATLDPKIIENLVIKGDLSGLTGPQKVEFYNYKCQQAGLDPAAKPFDLLTLNGKQILYANAGCTQQLTNNRKLSHQVTNRELVDGIYCVFVKVTDQENRSTENMGAVPVENLKGEAKANAMLKATTKAIRRAVLAHCGLGVMDEDEVATIPTAQTQKWEEPEVETVYPWTDEQREEAKQLMFDFMEQLSADTDLEEAAIVSLLDKPRSTVGDETIGFEKWANRFNGYCQRTLAKHGAK